MSYVNRTNIGGTYMKIEIDDITEVRELSLSKSGEINLTLPNYAGHKVKILIMKDRIGPKVTVLNTNNIDLHRIEGKRYIKGQKRSRATVKEFIRFMSQNHQVTDKTTSWLQLESGLQIRFASSVVYDGEAGDYLWYSFSYKDLISRIEKGRAILAFVIRDSGKLVFFKHEDVISEIKQVYNHKKKDWIHMNIVFMKGKVRFLIRRGKDYEDVVKDFDVSENYINWNEFSEIVG